MSGANGDNLHCLVRPEIRARFEEKVRERFERWKEAHPGVHVASATIRDEIKLMLVAMATTYDEDRSNVQIEARL